MELLTIATTGVLCIVCFFMGARIGQRVRRDEPVQLPKVEPVKAIKRAWQEGKEEKQLRQKQEQLEAILDNVDNYNGTALGQREIPGR